MIVTETEVPASSALDRPMVAAAYFRDSYSAPLTQPDAGMVQIFMAIFGHHPWWMKRALILRNRAVSLFGLGGPTASEIINFQVKDSYAVGDKIGVWPLFAVSDDELIAGRDDKHQDFRLSVLRRRDGERATVTVTTICKVHNLFGKVYLFVVIPFHKAGVRYLLAQAVAAGRL
jgi:hypothetical protein